ncbi:MAG TPA: transcriptional regulator [Marinilabiliales bacterium]|jgi:Rrf2 family protein|nr:transcriptional regulator [Marinilabiliales bacterium]
MLSNTSKYAIRAVIYLAVHASNGQKIGIKKISDSLEIPSPFLGKILQVLVRRKILSSTKGPNGGFGIGKNPDNITLYDIIFEMDGDELFHSCLLGAGSCDSNKKEGGYCALHNEFDESRHQMITLYKSKTVSELAAEAKEQNYQIVL